MERKPTNILAFTWYRQEDYEELLECAADPDELCESYEEWLVNARRAFVAYKRKGFDPRRVYLEIGELREWCRRRNRPLDQHSREVFKEIKRQRFYRKYDEWRSTRADSE